MRAFGPDEAGDQRVDFVAPDQPLAGDLVETRPHAVELQFAHGVKDFMAFHQATFRMLS